MSDKNYSLKPSIEVTAAGVSQKDGETARETGTPTDIVFPLETENDYSKLKNENEVIIYHHTYPALTLSSNKQNYMEVFQSAFYDYNNQVKKTLKKEPLILQDYTNVIEAIKKESNLTVNAFESLAIVLKKFPDLILGLNECLLFSTGKIEIEKRETQLHVHIYSASDSATSTVPSANTTSVSSLYELPATTSDVGQHAMDAVSSATSTRALCWPYVDSNSRIANQSVSASSQHTPLASSTGTVWRPNVESPSVPDSFLRSVTISGLPVYICPQLNPDPDRLQMQQNIDANAIIKTIEESLENQPEVFNNFKDLMKNFLIDSTFKEDEFVLAAAFTLKDYPIVIDSVNELFSPGFKIVVQEDRINVHMPASAKVVKNYLAEQHSGGNNGGQV